MRDLPLVTLGTARAKVPPPWAVSIIRGGPKRKKTRRERKWMREKTHRRRRAKWSRWPKMGWSGFMYFVNEDFVRISVAPNENLW